MPPLRRAPAERLAAWLLTGPVGHLGGGAADWLSLLVRWWRVERRGGRRGSSD